MVTLKQIAGKVLVTVNKAEVREFESLRSALEFIWEVRNDTTRTN